MDDARKRWNGQGGAVVHYRTFRNTDPPGLVEVWNETFTGRGAVQLQNSSPLERFVFAKPIFDPAGLIIAEEDGHCLGYAHAAVAPEDMPAPVPGPVGVVCLLGVRPSSRRHGVGSELLRRAEDYLRTRGAKTIYGGQRWPFNPFYLGLYGGCDLPGFLVSDAAAEPFFLRHDYQVVRKTLVMQRKLDQSIKIIDPRFAPLRQRFVVRAAPPRSLDNFWRECVLGFVEPIELIVEDKSNSEHVARAFVWEMEGFGCRWNKPAIGVLGFEVNTKWRRQGVGKFLLSQLLRQVQEQFFQIAEVHLDEKNQPAIQWLKSLAFEHIDTGQVFQKRESH